MNGLKKAKLEKQGQNSKFALSKMCKSVLAGRKRMPAYLYQKLKQVNTSLKLSEIYLRLFTGITSKRGSWNKKESHWCKLMEFFLLMIAVFMFSIIIDDCRVIINVCLRSSRCRTMFGNTLKKIIHGDIFNKGGYRFILSSPLIENIHNIKNKAKQQSPQPKSV